MKDAILNTASFSSPNITVYMPSSRNGRRFAMVSTLLSQMKLPHNAVFPLLRRIQLKGLEATAVKSDYCQLKWRTPSNTQVLITDQKTDDDGRKTIHISYDFMNYLSSDNDKNAMFLPILFHPTLLDVATYETARAYSAQINRPIGALFAGNCNPETYNNDRIYNRYGLANRHTLFQHIKTLPPEIVFIPASKENFENEMKRGSLREKLVWIDTEKFRIPQGEWLQLLSKARYFFCTPGVHYPYCQNLNEATACGTVPFLQYPGFYRPMLETDSTCIAFREISEIETLLINALSEDNSHWQKLSSSVAQWHHNHMSLDYARDTIRAFLQNPEVKTMTWIMAGK